MDRARRHPREQKVLATGHSERYYPVQLDFPRPRWTGSVRYSSSFSATSYAQERKATRSRSCAMNSAPAGSRPYRFASRFVVQVLRCASPKAVMQPGWSVPGAHNADGSKSIWYCLEHHRWRNKSPKPHRSKLSSETQSAQSQVPADIRITGADPRRKKPQRGSSQMIR